MKRLFDHPPVAKKPWVLSPCSRLRGMCSLLRLSERCHHQPHHSNVVPTATAAASAVGAVLLAFEYPHLLLLQRAANLSALLTAAQQAGPDGAGTMGDANVLRLAADASAAVGPMPERRLRSLSLDVAEVRRLSSLEPSAAKAQVVEASALLRTASRYCFSSLLSRRSTSGGATVRNSGARHHSTGSGSGSSPQPSLADFKELVSSLFASTAEPIKEETLADQCQRFMRQDKTREGLIKDAAALNEANPKDENDWMRAQRQRVVLLSLALRHLDIPSLSVVDVAKDSSNTVLWHYVCTALGNAFDAAEIPTNAEMDFAIPFEILTKHLRENHAIVKPNKLETLQCGIQCNIRRLLVQQPLEMLNIIQDCCDRILNSVVLTNTLASKIRHEVTKRPHLQANFLRSLVYGVGRDQLDRWLVKSDSSISENYQYVDGLFEATLPTSTGVSLPLSPDETSIVTGESGTGKTVFLLMMAARLLRAYGSDDAVAVTAYMRRASVSVDPVPPNDSSKPAPAAIPISSTGSAKASASNPSEIVYPPELSEQLRPVSKAYIDDICKRVKDVYQQHEQDWAAILKTGGELPVDPNDDSDEALARQYFKDLYLQKDAKETNDLLFKAVRNCLTLNEVVARVLNCTGDMVWSIDKDVKKTPTVFVIAIDEMGGDVDTCRALVAINGRLKERLFPNRKDDTLHVRLVVAGTGLASSAMPPGSMIGTYQTYYPVPSCRVFNALIDAYSSCVTKDVKSMFLATRSVLLSSDYYKDVLQNARMGTLAAMYTSQFVRMTNFSRALTPGFVASTVIYFAVMRFCGLNGLQGLTREQLLSQLVLAVRHHLFPMEMGRRPLYKNQMTKYGLLRDDARWSFASTEEGLPKHLETLKGKHNVWDVEGGATLVTAIDESRYHVGRSTMAIMLLAVTSQVLQSSLSGEGMELAGLWTMVVVAAASMGMPADQRAEVLRTLKPCLRTPPLGEKSAVVTEEFAEMSVVVEEREFARGTKDKDMNETLHPDTVYGFLSPPKTDFADSVVGVRDVFVTLVQSKDVKDITPLLFWLELFKMGDRGRQSVGAALTKSFNAALSTVKKNALQKIETNEKNKQKRNKKSVVDEMKRVAVKKAVAQWVKKLNNDIRSILPLKFAALEQQNTLQLMNAGPSHFEWGNVYTFLSKLDTTMLDDELLCKELGVTWDCPMADDVCEQFCVDRQEVLFVMQTRHPLPSSLSDGLPSNVVVMHVSGSVVAGNGTRDTPIEHTQDPSKGQVGDVSSSDSRTPSAGGAIRKSNTNASNTATSNVVVPLTARERLERLNFRVNFFKEGKTIKEITEGIDPPENNNQENTNKK